MSPSKPRVTMTGLGHYGAWGNQLIQYGFLRTYAERHGFDVETRPWAGQAFYDINDPPCRDCLPIVVTTQNPRHYPGIDAWLDPVAMPRHENVDLFGSCLHHTSAFAPHRDQWRSYFKIRPAIRDALDPSLRELKRRGRTLVALHMRLAADFGQHVFFRVPPEWYARWLEEHLAQFDRPVVFVATDTPSAAVGLVRQFGALTVRDLPPAPGVPDYFRDFFLLSQSDVLIGSNSSFSLSAAMLSKTIRQFLRPSLAARGFLPRDPWNTEPYLQENAADFPAVPGAALRPGELRRAMIARATHPRTGPSFAWYAAGRALATTRLHGLASHAMDRAAAAADRDQVLHLTFSRMIVDRHRLEQAYRAGRYDACVEIGARCLGMAPLVQDLRCQYFFGSALGRFGWNARAEQCFAACRAIDADGFERLRRTCP